MILTFGTVGMKKKRNNQGEQMNQTQAMISRFHVLGYFLVTLLFAGAGLILGASDVQDSIVVSLVLFAKFILLSFIIGLIGIWRTKELSTRLFFLWLIVIPVAYVFFLIMVMVTRVH